MSLVTHIKKVKVTSLIALLIITTFSTLALSKESNEANNEPHKQLNTLLSTHKGKVIYLDFWASWCGPCRKSFPWMNKIQKVYSPEKFTVISVNLDQNRELADEFLQALPANFPVIYDPKGTLAKKYKVRGMPSSYLFNQQGKIVKIHNGFFSKKIEGYENEIKQLIANQTIQKSNTNE